MGCKVAADVQWASAEATGGAWSVGVGADAQLHALQAHQWPEEGIVKSAQLKGSRSCRESGCWRIAVDVGGRRGQREQADGTR